MIEQILQADRYLQVDQVDKARNVYERVVELDPGNAIAVVGLARCALAEGDDQKAHALASKALEIDPENDMARRMEARLAEILATRGEAVERPDIAATPSSREMRPVVTGEPAPDDSPALATADATTTTADATTTTADATTTTADAGPPTPTPTPTPRPTSPTPVSKEPAVHKSLFDRLLGH